MNSPHALLNVGKKSKSIKEIDFSGVRKKLLQVIAKSFPAKFTGYFLQEEYMISLSDQSALIRVNYCKVPYNTQLPLFEIYHPGFSLNSSIYGTGLFVLNLVPKREDVQITFLGITNEALEKHLSMLMGLIKESMQDDPVNPDEQITLMFERYAIGHQFCFWSEDKVYAIKPFHVLSEVSVGCEKIAESLFFRSEPHETIILQPFKVEKYIWYLPA